MHSQLPHFNHPALLYCTICPFSALLHPAALRVFGPTLLGRGGHGLLHGAGQSAAGKHSWHSSRAQQTPDQKASRPKSQIHMKAGVPNGAPAQEGLPAARARPVGRDSQPRPGDDPAVRRGSRTRHFAVLHFGAIVACGRNPVRTAFLTATAGYPLDCLLRPKLRLDRFY